MFSNFKFGFYKRPYLYVCVNYMSICVSWAFSSPWSEEESAKIHGTDDHMGTMNFVNTCSL